LGFNTPRDQGHIVSGRREARGGHGGVREKLAEGDDMSGEPPRARVFISCGQSKTSDEPCVASKIRDRLRELGFDPYIAVEEQSLRGLTENVFAQLRKSEYFLFVDFKREKLADSEFHRGSLFSQQELAIASLLNIEVAALQEKGVVPLDGIMKFLQANAQEFTDRNRLPDTVANIVQRSQWNPSWRNELVLEASPSEDYRGAKCFHVRVQNRHRETLALNCSAYLEKVVKRPDTEIEIPGEIVELKWAANIWPRANIPARKARRFDAFFIRYAEPNKVIFQVHTDSIGHGPQIPPEIGEYELSFLVTSDNFPPVQKRFILDLRSSAETSLRLAP
jgi:hypothetical protein